MQKSASREAKYPQANSFPLLKAKARQDTV